MTQKYEGVYSQKIEKNRAAWLNIRTLNLALVAVIVAGGLYYVTGINDLVVKGFILQQLKTKVALLSEENQNLNVATASLKSYGNLAKRVADLKMVPVDNVDYLKVDAGVAMAR
ncbi:MAG TPA: hypothetical protein VMC41_00850 [Candidatus Nanoarchaeia archaeon]|nr:hypothetical protein [Candidatus Nanoarchaeia archaeon]